MTTCADCGYETGHKLRPMCPRQKDLDGIAGRVGELTAINGWIERAVQRLRAAGEPWDEIALALGISRQAAHKRFNRATAPIFEDENGYWQCRHCNIGEDVPPELDDFLDPTNHRADCSWRLANA